MKWTQAVSRIAAALLPAAAGCTVGPDYVRPDVELPAEWSHMAAAEEGAEQPLTLDDPVLAALLERVEAANPDLRAAVAGIDQARALRAFAGGEQLPSLDATGSYTRRRGSENAMADIPGENSTYTAGFDAFWELDLFGRIRRSVESAQAVLDKSVEDYRDVRISLYAETARNYIELRTAQMRLAYARANIEIQQKALELTRNLFTAQIAPELDVAQARLNLANTTSEIPSLYIAETAALNRLAVLAGTTPNTLRETLAAPAALPHLAALPSVGLPADLLRRRPDIRSAERALAAQTARIGAAEAQRYPSFALSGRLALEAAHISNMGDWDSRAFAFGPGVRWNLFDGNRLKSLVHVEEARTRQLAAAYEAAVLRAVEEVETAMVAFAQEQLRADALRQSVEAARQSVAMVETLYRSGLTNFQNVLDAQRSLFLQEDRLAVSEGLILQQAVALYKALGGGWEEIDN